VRWGAFEQVRVDKCPVLFCAQGRRRHAASPVTQPRVGVGSGVARVAALLVPTAIAAHARGGRVVASPGHDVAAAGRSGPGDAAAPSIAPTCTRARIRPRTRPCSAAGQRAPTHAAAAAAAPTQLPPGQGDGKQGEQARRLRTHIQEVGRRSQCSMADWAAPVMAATATATAVVAWAAQGVRTGHRTHEMMRWCSRRPGAPPRVRRSTCNTGPCWRCGPSCTAA
jgi:hypothetical protein